MKRTVIATTGFSFVLSSLVENREIAIVGIIDFQHGASDCTAYSLSNNIEYYKYDNDLPFLEHWLKALQPDMMVVYKAPFLFPETLFSIPAYGSINMHPSLLPQYKGPNPWFWIYYQMESVSGVTIHRIDRYEDHGEILAQAQFTVPLGCNLQELRLEAEKKGVGLLNDIIPTIERIKGYPQESGHSAFRACNVTDYKSIIDIHTMEGLRLWHLLRGFPWLLSTVCSDFNFRQEYVIGRFIPLDHFSRKNSGETEHCNGKIYIYCKEGIIEIVETTPVRHGDIDVDDLKRLTREDVVDRALKPHYRDRWRADEDEIFFCQVEKIKNRSMLN